MSNLIALPVGTELVSDYRVERVLGAGGFGITYLADEVALARSVTIKEYFPSDFAARDGDSDAAPRSQDSKGDYQWGLDRFIEEAQILARFSHPNIVRVYRYFKANNTAYMVLHFEEGQSFKSWLKSLGRAPRQKELDAILAPILDALDVIHQADFLHRDIAPDNIIIRNDGSPVLIDFGSARGEMAGHSKTVSALVKPGYSPYEQYAETSRQQGPWTDIYALAATIYTAIAGRRPPDAPSRVVQDDKPLARDAALSAYRKRFLAAIDRALNLAIEERPQSIAEWRGELLAPDDLPAKKPSRSGGWFQGGQKAKDKTPKPSGISLDRPDLSALPPRPDTPGKPGGLLDYLDNIKSAQPDPAAHGLVDLHGREHASGLNPAKATAARQKSPAASTARRDSGSDIDVQSRPPKPGDYETPPRSNLADANAPAGTAKLTSPPVFGFKGFKKPEATPQEQKPAPAESNRNNRKKDQAKSNAGKAKTPQSDVDQNDDGPPKHRKSWFSSSSEPKQPQEAHAHSDAKKGTKPKPKKRAVNAKKKPTSASSVQSSSHSTHAALPALRPRSYRPRSLRRGPGQSIGSGWRGLAIRLVIGVLVAGLAVTYQDRLRKVVTSTALNPQATSSRSIDLAAQIVPPPAHPRTIEERTRLSNRYASGQDATIPNTRQIQDKQFSPATPPEDNRPQVASAAFESTTIAARTTPNRDQSPSQPSQSSVPETQANQTRVAMASPVASTQSIAPPAIERNPLTKAITGHAGAILDTVVTSDERHAITSGEDATVRIWSLPEGEISRVIALEQGPAVTLASQKDWLATGHRGGFINIWDIKTGIKVAGFRRNEADIWALAFTSTEGRLAAAAHDWKIALWDIASPNQPLHIFDAHDSAVLSLAISPDGRYLASGGADKRVKLWNLDTLDAVRTFTRQRDFINTLAFSPDGKTLAAGNLRGDVVIGSSRSRRLSRRMSGHKKSINAVAFAPNGKVLATASDDGTVRIWDVRKRRTLKTLAGHRGKVAALTFTRSGNQLLSAGDDGTLRIWSLAAALQ
ncbi:MAG: protein kinase [Pseudomonadota bacterium]